MRVDVNLNLLVTTNDTRGPRSSNAIEEEGRDMKKQIAMFILKGGVELIQVEHTTEKW